MNHTKIAIETASGSTWDLDRFAQNHGWEGVGIIFTHHRDSDPFNKSNWDVIIQRMHEKFGVSPSVNSMVDLGPDIETAYFTHWAVGWMEHLCFNTAREDIAAEVSEIHQQLQEYPILDETHYNENYEKEEDQYDFDGAAKMADSWERDV